MHKLIFQIKMYNMHLKNCDICNFMAILKI